jgi:peptidoglycan endopeptidase LytE
MNFYRSFCFSLFFVLICFGLAENVFSQERERIVRNKPDIQIESQPINSPQNIIAQNFPKQIPNLNGKLLAQNSPLVKKIVSSQPVNAPVTKSISKSFYSAAFNSRLLQSIQAKIGTPYRYGSTGPNSYDCSGLVWSVFQEAGFFFERSSARTLWQNSEAVEGDDRFKFGTLIFFNGLGHIGIVADENGFYHASSSKGVTYSTFDGYWGKRIVGYRRLLLTTN